jgi:hypothetical protein
LILLEKPQKQPGSDQAKRLKTERKWPHFCVKKALSGHFCPKKCHPKEKAAPRESLTGVGPR